MSEIPVARIKIRVLESGTELRVGWSDQIGETLLWSGFNTRQLEQLPILITSQIAPWVAIAGERLPHKLADAAIAGDHLMRAGRALYLVLLRGCERLFHEVLFERLRTLTREAAPPGFPPPVIQLVGRHAHSLPIELLVSPFVAESPVINVADYHRVLTNVLCFSAVLSRMSGSDRVSQRLPDAAATRLRVQMFRNRKLRGAVQEERFLRQDPSIRAELRLWPPGKSSPPVKQLLSELRSSFGRAAHVQHFACHCERGSSPAGEQALDLGGGCTYKLQEMEQAMLRMPSGPGDGGDFPLCFLNACLSANVPPWAMESFAEYFLRTHGSAAYVGAGCAVDDWIAATYSHELYKRLVDGYDVGWAAYLARWALVYQWKNTIGALYSVHGNNFTSLVTGGGGSVNNAGGDKAAMKGSWRRALGWLLGSQRSSRTPQMNNQ